MKIDVKLNFLEVQLQWCKEQDRILEKVDTAPYEIEKVASLEKQLRPSHIITTESMK